jgi:hypothetical protein
MPNMKSRIATCLLVASALAGATLAAAAGAARAESHHPVNLTIFYPLGTNQDPAVSTNFRLSLIYGRVGSLSGVDLGGLVGRVDGNLSGLQFAGLHSGVGGDLTGATISAGVNYVRGDARGLQAGFVNYDRGLFAGLQYGYLFNFVEGGLRGVQISSVFSLVDGDARFVQISGAASAVGGSFRGVQIAAAVNHVNGLMTGVQIAGANMAADAVGAQAGFLNVAGTMKGAQIGMVNLSRELDGVPVGMVNVTGGAEVDWVTWGSNLAGVASGVRTIVNDWYSILSIGAADMLEDVNETAFIGWHYGRRLSLSRAWSLGADLGYLHIIPPKNSDQVINEREHPAFQGRFLVEWRHGTKFSVFAGGGASAVWDAYDKDADVSAEPLFFGGVSLY